MHSIKCQSCGLSLAREGELCPSCRYKELESHRPATGLFFMLFRLPLIFIFGLISIALLFALFTKPSFGSFGVLGFCIFILLLLGPWWPTEARKEKWKNELDVKNREEALNTKIMTIFSVFLCLYASWGFLLGLFTGEIAIVSRHGPTSTIAFAHSPKIFLVVLLVEGCIFLWSLLWLWRHYFSRPSNGASTQEKS